jgi:amino acid adenylation domain-containing protein/non-ribosomal peptide synthase protein (TIGR01720 family)
VTTAFEMTDKRRLLLEKLLKKQGLAPAAPRGIPRRAEAGPAPLSSGQQRLWFLYQMEPASTAYNLADAVRLSGPLNARALGSALAEVVRRHEALRTIFGVIGGAGDGEPVQIVLDPEPPALPWIDLSALPGPRRVRESRRLAGLLTQLPFDLARGPLLRPTLLRLDPADHVLVLVMHHIVSDGWSMGILVRELTALYGAFESGPESGTTPALPELPIQYSDFAAWQHARLDGETVENQLRYWRERVAGASTLLDLPTDRPWPAAQSSRGAREPLSVGAETAAALRELSQRHGATLFMTLLAALGVLLRRLTGQEDVLIGSPLANRDRPETAGLIGFFINTLVLRVEMAGDPAFPELLERVRESALGADAHQDLPFERLVEALALPRDLARTPLFQVMLAFQNLPAATERPRDVTVSGFGFESGTAQFELNFTLNDSPHGISGALDYRTELFDPATARRLVRHFEALLAGIARQPGLPVSELPLLEPAERQQVRVEWNDSVAGLTGPAALHRLLEAQAASTPDAVAVIFGEESLTYTELNARAERLARHLIAMGGGPERRVAVALERSAELVVALLAALKSGSAYVPLDPGYPRERLAFMLADARPAVLLTTERLREQLPSEDVPVLCLDALEDAPAADLPGPAGDLQLAYVIYTSGSTGRPKGAMVTHRALVNHMLWMQAEYPLTPADRVLQRTPVSFDASAWELWAPLCAGAGLVVVPAGEHGDPAALARTIESGSVTVVQAVPSLLREMLEGGELGNCATLRRVFCGGEALAADVQERFFASPLAGRAELINLYGPTETTIQVTSWRCAPEGADRPAALGRPIANARLHVVGPRFEEAPIGVAGEIVVGGAPVGRGYLERPDLTAERFVPDPFAGEPGARLYRTGDLGRFRTDGTLEYLGRVDHQVKVRGFRIELGEIEAEIAALPGVREAVVIAAGAPGGQRLVAYVTSAGDGEVETSALREALRGRLPEFMVPAAWVALAALPLAPNGKVDRRALPEPDLPAGEGFVAPRTPVEEILAGLWERVLDRARVGVRDNFFELGGHSLLATRIATRIREAFGIDLPLRTLFEEPTVAGLAVRIEEARRAGGGVQLPPIAPVPRQGELPLSFAQQRLWFLHQLDPESPVYNMPAFLRLTGPLDPRVFARSLTEVVRRHETLRTTFSTLDGRPVQRIAPPAPVPLPVVDLSALPEGDRDRIARRLASEEAARPFDLSRPPVVRAQMVKLSEGDHVLLVTLHHVSTDGWSMDVLSAEIAELYGSIAGGRPARLPALPVQYADFAAWQRGWLHGELLEGQLAWWRAHLAGAPPVLELPLDRPRPPAQTYRGSREELVLPPEIVEPLQALGRREAATLFMVLLAAFQTLLHRLSGQDSIVVGTPIANRSHAELERLIGFFANTLALRADLSDDPGFRALLGRMREASLGAYEHQDLPFEKLVDELKVERDLSHSPVFQVLFVFQAAGHEMPAGELALAPFGEDSGVARYDLTLACVEQPGNAVILNLDYNVDLFERGTVARLGRSFASLLAAVVADPEAPVSGLPLLDPEERRQVVHGWNQTGHDLPGEPLLHRLVAAHARSEAAAIVHQGEVLTHGEMERRANRLARYLVRLGVGPEVRVALAFERSPEAITSMLAVLKAGGAYVPLDPEAPRDRLAAILADSGAALLLTHERLAPTVMGLSERLVRLEAEREAIERESPEPLATDVHPENPDNAAYVIYTSGSTGAAKGVVVSHRAAANFVQSFAEAISLGAGDRLLLFAPLSFDASVLQIFPALASGAAVVVHRNPRELVNHEMLGFCERNGVTVLDLPAPLLRQWVEDVAARGLTLPDGLRLFLTGGESVPVARLRTWAGLAGLSGRRVGFLSSYGPTEATVTSTVYQTSNDRVGELVSVLNVPIGRPLPNVRAYVLDRRMQPVPRGVAGELFVGGAGVARGYLGRPDLTAAAFVPDPFAPEEGGEPGGRLYRTGDLARRLPEGDLEFLGRADHQVKIRGFRLELSEVESALARHPAVRETVVLLREDRPGDKRLAAYVVLHGSQGEAPTVGDLRVFLSERLPQYMVPSAFVTLPEFPTLASGKVDRSALPAPDASRSAEEDYTPPRTPEEELLAGIWAQVLNVPRVGVHDNFFSLGGDSILSIQIIARANEAGLALTPKQLFDHQTVAELIHAAVTAAPEIVAEQEAVSGPVPLSALQRWFFDLFIDPHHFNHGLMMESPQGPLNPRALERALAVLVDHHDALRQRAYRGDDGRWRLEMLPAEPQLGFAVVDFKGLPEELRPRAFHDAIINLSGGFDLERGPLTRLTLFDAGERGSRLHWLHHHLVIDGVSWRVLLEDLPSAYRQALDGAEPRLPRKTTSLKTWAERLAGYAATGALDDEVEYWMTVARAEVPPFPLDFPDGLERNSFFSTRNAAAMLTEEETQALLQTVPATFRTQINDALLAALVLALAPWTGRAVQRIDVESHGREPLFDDVDLNRTVGWFTIQYPMLLDLEGAADPGEAVTRVKEQLRRIPRNGIGYGILRYSNEEGEVSRTLAAAPEPEISFNYLGQFDTIFPAAEGEVLLRPTSDPTGPSRSNRSRRTHVLEYTGLVTGGRMQVSLGYSANLHRRETIERLVENFVAALRALIAHCQLVGHAELTPSDFPLARLDDASFQKLASLLDDEDED